MYRYCSKFVSKVDKKISSKKFQVIRLVCAIILIDMIGLGLNDVRGPEARFRKQCLLSKVWIRWLYSVEKADIVF